MDLDAKAFDAAKRAYGRSFPDALTITFDGMEAAIRAYLASVRADAAARHAEIVALFDNPEPPTEKLKAAHRDARTILPH